MYEELVKRLWECASGECFNCSQYTETTNASVCSKELMKQAANAIKELTDRNVGEWIPVKKKKPEHGQYVLAIFKNSGGYFVLDTHDLYKDGNKTWSKSAVKPLAWIPLPERPPWPWKEKRPPCPPWKK